MNALQSTLDVLGEARAKTDSVLVSYSAGKDSMICLDLCMRTFKRVECFFMYFIEGLRHIEEKFEETRKRYPGLIIRQQPHHVVIGYMKGGMYCDAVEDLPDWSLADCHAQARRESGIDLIVHGAKKTDSLWRKRHLSVAGNRDGVLYPIEEWNKLDVLAYLAARGIPLPSSAGTVSSGVGLSTPSLLWLHDNHPDDFAKIEAVFPYVNACVYRRRWYGVV